VCLLRGTDCIHVFCVDLRTNSDYFPIQHLLIGFYNRDVGVHCAVRIDLYVTLVNDGLVAWMKTAVLHVSL
jgi:hypothetical protein